MAHPKKTSGLSSAPQDPPSSWRGTRGRGALSNKSGRFEPLSTEHFDDGWSDSSELPERLATEITRETARRIITKNSSPDISFDRSINPYRGCEHGCIYCFARPTHAFVGLSPGLDFETKLFAKPNAPSLLAKELSNKRYQVRPIAMGTNTDPYQPIERRLEITRQVLEVLKQHRHPISIVTKSSLVTRDIDILAEMAELNLAKVILSVTSLDAQLARAIEPRASTPNRRIEAIRALSQSGIPAGVMMAPIIPALNDHEIEAILETASIAGAQFAAYVLIRLPLEIRDLFPQWLQERVPDRASHVMSLIRQMRNGRDYDPQWHKRMRGDGPYAQLIARRFELAKKKNGFGEDKTDLNTMAFRRPPAQTDQLSLFDE